MSIQSQKLPSPVSISDEYARAILDELRGLRADLAARPAPGATIPDDANTDDAERVTGIARPQSTRPDVVRVTGNKAKRK
jgi:hypothetical protein